MTADNPIICAALKAFASSISSVVTEKLGGRFAGRQLTVPPFAQPLYVADPDPCLFV
jgi:hypothetical protein